MVLLEPPLLLGLLLVGRLVLAGFALGEQHLLVALETLFPLVQGRALMATTTVVLKLASLLSLTVVVAVEAEQQGCT